MYKSFILFVACIIILFAAVGRNNDLSSQKSLRTETSGTMSALSTSYPVASATVKSSPILKSFGARTDTLSPQALNYGLQRLGVNKSNKKIVVYPKAARCPYGKDFVNSIEKYKSSNSNDYVYKQLSAPMNIYATIKNDNDMKIYKERVVFTNACNMFCVIDTQTGVVYSTNSVGENETRLLADLLDELKK